MPYFSFRQLRRFFQRPGVRPFSRTSCSAEQFEVRLLPAGNVIATVVGDNLVLSGDAEDNSVRIEISGGNVVVTGLDGTTINGDPDFEAVTGSTSVSGDVVANLGRGDDKLAIGDDVVVEGDLRVTDAKGATTLGLRNVEIQGDLLVKTGRGSDAVSLVDTTIAGDAKIATHRGKDFVSLLQSTVTGSIEVLTGRGTDGVVIDDSELSSSARLKTGRGRDAALIRQTTIAEDLSARTGRGADFLMLQDATVEGETEALMQQGGDAFVTQDTVEFKGSAVIRGGRGRRDAIDLSAGTTFDAGELVRGFRHNSVPTSLIDSILNDADTGLLTLAADLQDEIDDLLA
jgi:hypothetical protein